MLGINSKVWKPLSAANPDHDEETLVRIRAAFEAFEDIAVGPHGGPAVISTYFDSIA